MTAEGSGSLFGAEVPRIGHEDDDEHDFSTLAFRLNNAKT